MKKERKEKEEICSYNMEGRNYTEEYKCKYCKYSCLGERCEYYSCKYNLKICK